MFGKVEEGEVMQSDMTHEHGLAEVNPKLQECHLHESEKQLHLATQIRAHTNDTGRTRPGGPLGHPPGDMSVLSLPCLGPLEVLSGGSCLCC